MDRGAEGRILRSQATCDYRMGPQLLRSPRPSSRSSVIPGEALLQRGNGIAYTSRVLTETERRYAQIEEEMLAIVFSPEKFHQYTYEHHVKLRSDPKPLDYILQKPLACALRRLQGMMSRLQKYDYEVWYERGEKLHLADTLSRAHLPTTAHPTGAEFEHINTTAFFPRAHFETSRDPTGRE